MDGLPVNIDHIHRLVFHSSTPCQAMICYGSWRTTSLNSTHPWDGIPASWLARIWWQRCRSLGLIRRWVYLCTYTYWWLLITEWLDSGISWGGWLAMGRVPTMWQYALCVRSLAHHNAISRWKKFGFCKSFFEYCSNFCAKDYFRCIDHLMHCAAYHFIRELNVPLMRKGHKSKSHTKDRAEAKDTNVVKVLRP